MLIFFFSHFQNPTERLGYQREGVDGIRNHRWYQGFDWEKFRAEALPAPIISEVKDYLASSILIRAEKFAINQNLPTEDSGWDKDF